MRIFGASIGGTMPNMESCEITSACADSQKDLDFDESESISDMRHNEEDVDERQAPYLGRTKSPTSSDRLYNQLFTSNSMSNPLPLHSKSINITSI